MTPVAATPDYPAVKSSAEESNAQAVGAAAAAARQVGRSPVNPTKKFGGGGSQSARSTDTSPATSVNELPPHAPQTAGGQIRQPHQQQHVLRDYCGYNTANRELSAALDSQRSNNLLTADVMARNMDLAAATFGMHTGNAGAAAASTLGDPSSDLFRQQSQIVQQLSSTGNFQNAPDFGEYNSLMDAYAAAESNSGVLGNNSADGNNGSNRPPSSRKALQKIEIKLFVGRLPVAFDEETVRPLFDRFGEVIEVAIIRDKLTGAHKGSCFVRMASITEADAAIRGLRAEHPKLQIAYATGEPERLGFTPGALIAGEDEAKLFVGSLPRDVTEAAVEQFFSDYGRAFDCYLIKDPNTQRFRGCCFVKMDRKEDALIAVKQLHGIVLFPGASRRLEVRIAEPKRNSSQQQQMSQAPPHLQLRMSLGLPPNGIPPSMLSGAADNVLPLQNLIVPENNLIWGSLMSGLKAPMLSSPETALQEQQMHEPAGGPLRWNASNMHPRCVGNWKEYFSSDGRPYYHNELSHTTQWDMPAEFLYTMPQTHNDFATALQPGLVGMRALGRDYPLSNGDTSLDGRAAGGSGSQIGPPGANVFIFHVPSEWTSTDLTRTFSQVGRVLSAKIAMDRSTGRNRGYGFVSFDNVASALKAIQVMNAASVGTKRLRVTIKNGEEGAARFFAEEHGIPFPSSRTSAGTSGIGLSNVDLRGRHQKMDFDFPNGGGTRFPPQLSHAQ